MKIISREIPIALILLTLLGCSSALVKKEKIKKLNDQFKESAWLARVDITAPAGEERPEIIFKKGKKLKIWINVRSEWIRVKAYPATQKREHAYGKTIIYFFADELEDEIELARKSNIAIDEEEYILKKLKTKMDELLKPTGKK